MGKKSTGGGNLTEETVETYYSSYTSANKPVFLPDITVASSGFVSSTAKRSIYQKSKRERLEYS